MQKPELYGKYLLIDLINVGGMAEVFKAKVLGVSGFHKIVAIKRILPTFSEQYEFVKMFVDEANIAGELHHHNIAQIYDLGEIEGTYYISMEFVEGRDLRAIFDRLKKLREPIPPNMAAYICEKVLAGLDYAHNKVGSGHEAMGIVHRDVSPPNILISYNGEVKLVDFGIAKAAGKISQTQVGVLKGKFGYMSPEQVRGLTVDGRSDLFSVGVVLWEMLAGKRLFVGENDYDTLEKVRLAEIENPLTFNQNIPEPLAKIAMRALERDLKKRYRSAEAMRRELQQYLYTLETPFTFRDAGKWMQSSFGEELAHSKGRMEEIRQMDLSEFGIDEKALAEKQENLFQKSSVEPKPKLIVEVDEPAKIEKENASPKKRPSLLSTVAILSALLLLIALAGFHVVNNIGGSVVDFDAAGEATDLEITANQPDVQVSIDGKPACETPCKVLNIPVGKHSFDFELQGYLADHRDVELNKDKAAKLHGEVFLPGVLKGVLMLRSEPAGARILYNGRISKVVTPTVLKSIPVGQEELIRFNMEGYKDKEIKVVLKRDEIKEMNVKLIPLTPTVRVLTRPPGAEIFLDGKSTGKLTPSSISKLEADKNYSVKTALKGFRAVEREVRPMKDEEVLIEFDLEKERHKSNNVQKVKEKFGLLDVNTTPPTKIYIDGRYSGFHSPAKGIKLKPGSHEIKLINPEKNVHDINKVNIEVGTPASIDKVF